MIVTQRFSVSLSSTALGSSAYIRLPGIVVFSSGTPEPSGGWGVFLWGFLSSIVNFFFVLFQFYYIRPWVAAHNFGEQKNGVSNLAFFGSQGKGSDVVWNRVILNYGCKTMNFQHTYTTSNQALISSSLSSTTEISHLYGSRPFGSPFEHSCLYQAFKPSGSPLFLNAFLSSSQPAIPPQSSALGWPYDAHMSAAFPIKF